MKEDFKIDLPEDKQNVYVGISDPYWKNENNEFAVCVVRKNKDSDEVLGSKVIELIGRPLEEKQEVFNQMLEYYKDCNIVVETDDSLYQQWLFTHRPKPDLSKIKLEDLFSSPEAAKKFKEDSTKRFQEWLLEDRTKIKLIT